MKYVPLGPGVRHLTAPETSSDSLAQQFIGQHPAVLELVQHRRDRALIRLVGSVHRDACDDLVRIAMKLQMTCLAVTGALLLAGLLGCPSESTEQEPPTPIPLPYCDSDEPVRLPAVQVGHTTEVCSYPDGASDLGFCDLAGNVLEWTSDRHGDYTADPQTNPVGSSDVAERVIRGGSWNHEAARLLTWDRHYDPLPSEAYGGIGFRVVKLPQ